MKSRARGVVGFCAIACAMACAHDSIDSTPTSMLSPAIRILLTSALVSFAPPSRAHARTDLLVASRFTDEVLAYDATTGSFRGVFADTGGLDNPIGITFGPDGHLYVASSDSGRIVRYHGQTGAWIDTFADDGPLSGARHLNFGPDGHLYLAAGPFGQIVRYDGVTGDYLGVFRLFNSL